MAFDPMALTPAQLAQLQAQYGNIGTPTANTDNRYGANGGGNGYYSAGGLDYLTPTAGGGFSGPVGAPFDQPGAGGQYGQYQGTFGADGALTGGNFQPMQRESWLDKNGWIAPLLPIAASFVGNAIGGQGFGPTSGEMQFTGARDTISTMAGGGGGGAGGTVAGDALAANAYLEDGLVSGAGGGAGGSGDGILGGPSGVPNGAPPMPDTPPVTPSGAVGKWILENGKWIAAAAGTIIGANSGGPDTATKSSNVPEWAQPYSRDLVQRGQDIANTPFQPYTGQRYAGPNDATKNSWEMANQFASGGPSAGQMVSQGTFNRLQSGNTPGFGNAERVNNQYIGQNTNANVSSLVSGAANPYLDKQTQQIGPMGQMNLAQTTTDVGRNALLGQNNPYLNDAIGFATGDITRNFTNTVNPGFDRMARASGSFGNSGVEQARAEAQRTMAQQIGRTTSDMRMSDYNLQAQLGEGDLGRRTSAALTDAQRNLGASQAQQQFNIGTEFNRQNANAGYGAADLSRSMAGYNTQQTNLLNAGMYDTTARANDITRNANLAGQQGQFNAAQGNFDITGNRNDWNSAEGRALSSMDAWKGYDTAATNRIAMLNGTGAEMNRYAQQPLDFAASEFTRQQQYPAQQLSAYGQAYNTGVGGQSVQSTPTGSNPVADTIGGLTAGIGLYNMFTAPPQQPSPGVQSNQFDPITGRRYA